MNARDPIASWNAFRQASGFGAPISNEEPCENAQSAAAELMDELAANECGPIAGLVELLTKRIQGYEVRPWPNTAAPAVLEAIR